MADVNPIAEDPESYRGAEIFDLRGPLGPSSPWPQQRPGPPADADASVPMSVDPNDSQYDSEVARFHTHVAPKVVADHAVGIDRAEKAISRPRITESGNRDRLDAATAETLHALHAENKARSTHEWAEDHPETCETRRVSGGLLAVVSVVVAVVLFLLDRILLRRAFFLDSVGMVTGFAAVIGAIQAASAHMAGKHHKHLKFGAAHRRDREASTDKIWRDVAATVGIGSELLLGILRARGTGQLITSILLVAGGITMWALIASLSWGHACRTGDRLAKSSRAVRKANRRRLRRRRAQAASARAFATAQGSYLGKLGSAVADYESEVVALNAHLVSSGKQPIVPALPAKVEAWSELTASRDLPGHLTLPAYAAPDIPPIAYFIDPLSADVGAASGSALALSPGAVR